MSVRAKMMCTLNKQSPYGFETYEIWFEAVYSNGDDDNASRSKYTPSGQLLLTVSNPLAFGHLEQGKTYWIDINPVE